MTKYILPSTLLLFSIGPTILLIWTLGIYYLPLVFILSCYFLTGKRYVIIHDYVFPDSIHTELPLTAGFLLCPVLATYIAHCALIEENDDT